jgi:hypothetical protein
MRYPSAIVIAFAMAGGAAALPGSAQQPIAPPPAVPVPPNLPFTVALTCGEFLRMLHSPDKTAGTAIQWLDGYYSARAGITYFPSDWRQTVAQGVGGTCAINVNASRPVLDVIAQLHAEYGVSRR